MNEFKTVPGFNGKYEIDASGTVRNVKTQKVTNVSYTSKKLGPIVALSAGEENARVSVLKLVNELFGTAVAGWEDVDLSKASDIKVVKTVITPEEKAARAQAKADKAAAKAVAKAQKAADKAAALEVAKAKAADLLKVREAAKAEKEAAKAAKAAAKAAAAASAVTVVEAGVAS